MEFIRNLTIMKRLALAAAVGVYHQPAGRQSAALTVVLVTEDQILVHCRPGGNDWCCLRKYGVFDDNVSRVSPGRSCAELAAATYVSCL